MNVDRMYIVTRFAHVDAVSLALLHVECSRHDFSRHRVSGSVHRPTIEAFVGGVVFGESHLEGLVYVDRSAVRFPEEHIVPSVWRWGNPFRLPRTPSIINHDSHTVTPIIIVQITHNPHAGMAHFHDC